MDALNAMNIPTPFTGIPFCFYNDLSAWLLSWSLQFTQRDSSPYIVVTFVTLAGKEDL